MADNNEDKEKKRRKMFKKMSKVLASCWQMPDATPFQDDEDDAGDNNKNGGKKRNSSVAVAVWKGFTLAPIGRKIDEKVYRFGRHGWEDFAADLGKVYNVHIQRYVHSYVSLSIYAHTFYTACCLSRLANLGEPESATCDSHNLCSFFLMMLRFTV
jgi:hypothetical protein